MKLARPGSWKSVATRRVAGCSLIACSVLSVFVAATACSDARDGAISPPPFNGAPGTVDETPATPPAGVGGAAQDPGSDGLGDVDQGLPLAPTDDDDTANETLPVEEPPVEQPPEEPPADPNAPVQCTPSANPGSQSDGDVNIVLDSEFQKITGFGGVSMIRFFSGSTLTPGQVDIAFGTGDNQLGLSILRYPISDNPNEWDDELPAAQRAIERGAMVFATPWTPPANLKNNNSTVGGSLLPQNFGAYADHLLGFRDFMAENGVPVSAISVQNEPDIEVDYDSCDWTSQEISDFLIQQGPRFGDTRVIAAESFNFNRALTDPILNNAQAVQQFDIVAGHLYGRAPFDYALAREQGKEVWMTEHYTDSGNEPDRANQWPLALGVAAEMHAAMTSNYNAYVWWYIRRGYGLILDNEQVSKRGWLFSQYSRFVRPGYVRVQASDPPGVQGVDVTAYKNGPGKVVVVALNQSNQAQTINLDVFGSCVTGFERFTTSQTKNRRDDGAVTLANGRVQVTLDAQSLTTFVSQDVASE